MAGISCFVLPYPRGLIFARMGPVHRGETMNPAAATLPAHQPNALAAILWGGFACGVLDITAALLVYGFFGLKPVRLLQGIAGGLLGPRTFNGGPATAILGLLCHFLIAFSAATVYFALSRAVPFRCSLRRGRVLLHAAHRCAALGRHQISLFFQDDGHRRGHPHLLRRPPHRHRRPAIRREAIPDELTSTPATPGTSR